MKNTNDSVRVQKWIAELGVSSRHEAEKWIKEGRVCINGNPVAIGDKIDPSSKIHLTLDGVPIIREKTPPKVYWILNKPELVLTSRESSADTKTNIYDLPALKSKGFLVNPVGRLDYRTQGLLLLTNDGDMAYKLSHPRFGLERKYMALISGKLTREQENLLNRGGVKLPDGVVRCKVTYTGGVPLGGSQGAWYSVIVTEGRNRLVRRMFEHFDSPVIKLIRFGFGPIFLPSTLAPGKIRALTADELTQLKKATVNAR